MSKKLVKGERISVEGTVHSVNAKMREVTIRIDGCWVPITVHAFRIKRVGKLADEQEASSVGKD